MSNVNLISLLATALAGWVNRHQQAIIDYLIEENRIFKQQLNGRRLQLSDNDRRRLAAKAKDSGDACGYDRLQGALANLGHTVSSSTVANILKRHGIEPAPERGKRTSRRTFLKAHWDVMAATDLFTIEGWTPNGLVTYYVLFIIHLATRKISIADATPNPTVLS